jgi:hypothetical protein
MVGMHTSKQENSFRLQRINKCFCITLSQPSYSECYSSGAASASKAVRAFGIDGGTTRTLMRLTQFGSEA